MNTPAMSRAAIKAMTDYVDDIIQCWYDNMNEGDRWPLGEAWKATVIWAEQAHIAAAIIYESDLLSDALYRVIGARGEGRGEWADERLCLVADELGLA
jgi:hypothetical protein